MLSIFSPVDCLQSILVSSQHSLIGWEIKMELKEHLVYLQWWSIDILLLRPSNLSHLYLCTNTMCVKKSISGEFFWFLRMMWVDVIRLLLITRMIVLYKTSFLLFILSGKTCICTSAYPKMLPSLHIGTERTDRERSHGTNWNTHKHTTDVCYEWRDNNRRREGWRTDRWNGNPEDLR